MSHELRTPLNSLLILAEHARREPRGQPDAPSRSSSPRRSTPPGSDLLALINDILDLSKIESGTMAVDVGEVAFAELREYVERTFRQVAEHEGPRLRRSSWADGLPASIATDAKRLQQVLKNLLSNALQVHRAGRGRPADRAGARRLEPRPRGAQPRRRGRRLRGQRHRHRHPGGQAAGSSSRRSSRPTGRPAAEYGGTGLGLSISREIARLLGGEIRVASTVGQGSTFTLYLPRHYRGATATSRATRPRGRADRPAAAPAVAGPPHRRSPRGPGRRAGAVHRQGGAGDAMSPAGADVAGGGRRRPRRPRARRPGPADRRGRRRASPASCSTWPTRRASRAGRLAGRRRPGPGPQPRPDAITLDIRLPDMDGWAVLDRLKHDPRPGTSRSTSSRSGTTSSAGLKLGRLALLKKPVSARPWRRRFAKHPARFVERRREEPAGRRGRPTRARQHRRADRRRRRRAPPSAPAGRPSTPSRPGGSTAWCSTWGCPT